MEDPLFPQLKFSFLLLLPRFLAPLSFLSKIGVGMLSGGIGGLCGNPADVVNIRMQADGRLPVAERRNYKHAFGLPAFFSPTPATSSRLLPGGI